MYSEEKKFVSDGSNRAIELDGDKIQLGLEQGNWNEAMEGQWILLPQNLAVS